MTTSEFAERLRNAQEQRQPIAPLREEIGTTDIALAYEIQNVNTEHRISNGARVIGKKIGLTSKAVQHQLGVDQPDFGILFHDMEVLNGGEIAAAEILQPKVEAEFAFVLGQDLDGPELTSLDVMEAIDYCLPSIEIVGSRIRNWDIRITDTIADNASASHFVLGHQPRTLDELDIIRCPMRLWKNGDVVSTGVGANCLGSPINAVHWLANTMYALGTPLEAGELILSGAIGPMCPVVAGDQIITKFDGMGPVSVRFL